MKLATRLGPCALLLVVVACASGATSGGGDPDRITTEEIRESPASNMYELVQSLHPAWLRKRGQHSISGADDIVVYYDNARMGGPATLRGIPTAAAMSAQFFSAAAATYRWGQGHTHGVILVSTQDGR